MKRFLIAAGISVGLLGGFAAPAHATFGHTHKVTICHATGSATNPYVRINVSENSTTANGHELHVDDVFLGHDDENDLLCPGPTGPQGPAGPTGPTGPQGPAGEDGTDGTTPVAVCTADGGLYFVTEEPEELAEGSFYPNAEFPCYGPAGEDGLPGTDGIDGVGIVGAAGPTGEAGAAGSQGPAGPAGDPALQQNCLTADGFRYSAVDCDGADYKDYVDAAIAALKAGEAPPVAPEGVTPITELPKTGGGSVLLLLAAALVAGGGFLWALARR